MKDMRVGQFDFDLAEDKSSGVFYVKKQSKYTTNFLFAAEEGLQDNVVIVENEVPLNYPSVRL